MRADWWNRYVAELKVPFKDKGRDELGCDCWGLVCLIYKEQLGIDLPSYLECYETTKDKEVLGILIADERAAKWSEPETPEPFDVIILKMRGVPMHVGLVTKSGHMIHCARGIGTVHEPFTSSKWKNNVIGYARYSREPENLCLAATV